VQKKEVLQLFPFFLSSCLFPQNSAPNGFKFILSHFPFSTVLSRSTAQVRQSVPPSITLHLRESDKQVKGEHDEEHAEASLYRPRENQPARRPQNVNASIKTLVMRSCKAEQRPSAKGSQGNLYLNDNHVHAAARRAEAGLANPDLLMRLKVQIDMGSWALNHSSQRIS
jgi:hypothetical protein